MCGCINARHVSRQRILDSFKIVSFRTNVVRVDKKRHKVMWEVGDRRGFAPQYLPVLHLADFE